MKRLDISIITITLMSFLVSAELCAQTTVTLNDGENNATAYDTTGNDTTFSIASGSATQSGIVSGSGSVIKTGAGTVEFTGNNNFSGAIDVQEGTLSYASPANLYMVNSGISVGDSATATLSVLAGGYLSTFGNLTLGNTSAGHGTLSLDGNPSLSWSMFVNGDMIVGNAGSGTMNVTAGAFPVTSGAVRLGAGVGGNGTLLVDDGGNMSSLQGLVVGEAANSSGSVTVSNAGFLTAGYVELGAGAGSQGQLTIESGGVLALRDDAGDALRAGAGTASVSINGGILRSASGTFTTSVPLVISNTATFDTAGSNMTINGDISGSGSLNVTGGNELTLAADTTYTGGTTVSNYLFRLGAGGTTGSVLGNITNNGTVEFNRSDDHSFSGVISGTGAVEKRGTNNLTLTADHTYTGGTTVWTGTLTLGTGGATGSVAGDIYNRGTVVFNRSGDHTYNGVISGTGSVVHDGNILRLTSAQTYTGATVLNSGYFVLPTDTDQALSAATTLDIASGATLDISNRKLEVAGLTGGGQVYSFGGSAGELTVNTAAGPAQNFSGSLGSTYADFSLVKSGDGTLVLSGANSYTGATTVSDGILAVNGSISASSGVTVESGGTLQGSGVIMSAVDIQGGGTLAAGNSIESLATGSLTLAAGATFAYEMDNDAAPGIAGDLTAVTGDLVLDIGNASLLALVDFGAGAWDDGDKLTLISYSGSWNGGLFQYDNSVLYDGDTINFSGIDWIFDYDDTTAGTNYASDLTGSRFVTMVAVPVPEPGAVLLSAFGLLALLRRSR